MKKPIRPMKPKDGRGQGIDPVLLRALWAEKNLTTRQIAERLDAGRDAVSSKARHMGLPRRPLGGTLSEAAAREAKAIAAQDLPKQNWQAWVPYESPLPAHPIFDEARDLDIISARGRYAEQAKLSEEWDLPINMIVARWHSLRSTLPMEAVRALTKPDEG